MESTEGHPRFFDMVGRDLSRHDIKGPGQHVWATLPGLVQQVEAANLQLMARQIFFDIQKPGPVKASAWSFQLHMLGASRECVHLDWYTLHVALVVMIIHPLTLDEEGQASRRIV